ncbi:ribosome biogenesis protein Alb1 [Geopyxis carbonaria]|nr:ribosome biogenesis protein Alb1 [Geopyxis carbonaria]
MGPSRAPKSRAAKRAVTPPIEGTKSTERVNTPTQKEKVAILGLRGDAGISKKKSRKKQLSTKQKQRKEAAMEKGEAALEKLDHKREESKQRGRIVQARRGNWSELNEKIEVELEQVTKPVEIDVK